MPVESEDEGDPETPPTATPPLPSSVEGIQPLGLVGGGAVGELSHGFLAVLEPELVRVHRSLEELV